MKLAVVVYEAGIDDSMMDLVRRLELPGWTKLEGAVGFGRKGPREGTPIWPGTNNVVFAVLEDAEIPRVLSAIQRLKEEYLRPPAVFAFVLPVDEVR